MEQPIASHRASLAALRARVFTRQREMNRLLTECRELDLKARTLEAMIAQAEREGRTSFDSKETTLKCTTI